ncbi:hypothetical protein D3C73_856400 [compost metagenome]
MICPIRSPECGFDADIVVIDDPQLDPMDLIKSYIKIYWKIIKDLFRRRFVQVVKGIFGVAKIYYYSIR